MIAIDQFVDTMSENFNEIVPSSYKKMFSDIKGENIKQKLKDYQLNLINKIDSEDFDWTDIKFEKF